MFEKIFTLFVGLLNGKPNQKIFLYFFIFEYEICV